MATTARLDLSIWRNDDVYEFPLRIRGADLTNTTMTMHIRLGRDVPGYPLVALAKVTNGNAEGLRVAGVTIEDAVPVTDLRIRINKSTRQDLPYAGEIGDDAVLQYALVIGGKTRLVGQARILAHAYDSDAAPANRPAGYSSGQSAAPSEGATLTIQQDGGATITLDGADLIGASVALAESYAGVSEDFAGQSGASAQAASAASATAIQVRDAIIDQLADARTYVTKAEAVADLANISPDAFASVLTDETRFGHWVIYRKVNGALQFVLDRNAGAHVTLEQFGAVADCDPVAVTGTPADAALEAAFTALYLAGGGEIRALGRYLFTNALLLPNTNTEAAIGTQPSFRIVGQGCSMNGGKGDRWIAKTLFFWAGDAGGAVAKIDTRGIGALTCLDLDFGASPDATVKPFFHTTFTAILASRCGFVTSQTGPDCTQDAFVFGGTVDFETIPSFDRRSADCGFQGYGTSVTNCFFNGIRRVARFQRYANDINFSFNNIWGACGNATGTGAAIEADGGNTYSVGNNIVGNLFEMHAYKTAIDIDWCSAWKIWGNSAYDASSEYTETVVRVRENCAGNISVITGLNNPRAPGDVYRPYLDDPNSKVASFVSQYREEPSRFASLQAGDDLSPNRLGTTRFDAPGAAPVTYQSRQAEVPTAPVRLMVRYGGNLVTPAAADVIHIVRYGGAQEIGGGSAGNVYNHNAANGGAGWWEGGKSYGFDRTDPDPARRVGGNLLRDSGTGGSYIFDRAVRIVWEDHTGQASGYYEATSGEMRVKSAYFVAGKQVLGARLPAISDDKTTDEKVALILAAMRAHGQIET